MNRIVLIFGIFLVGLSPSFIYAGDTTRANHSQWYFGMCAGANYNQFTGLQEMIVSEDYYTGYSLDSKYRFGFTGGVFFNYRVHRLFGIQPEILYSMQPGRLQYSDINDFKYDLDFKYNYLNVGVSLKLYPWRHLFLSVSPQVGFPLTPNKLQYISNGEDMYGPDMETQQLMSNVIKGSTCVSIGFGLGYQFLNKIYIDARYCLGINDMIETLPNSYRFAEVRNTINSVQFTIGYAFSISKNR